MVDINLPRATSCRAQLIRLFLFNRCTQFGIPAMCFHIFPTCDARTQDSKPRLCREDCFALFEDVCLTELQLAKMDPLFSALLPNCSALPKRDNKDHSYCTSLGIPGQYSANVASVGDGQVLVRLVIFWQVFLQTPKSLLLCNKNTVKSRLLELM